MQQFLLFSPEVAAARAAGKPVVALESTIISHGMPYPQNVTMAREVEQLIRDAGAVPATIAIIGGKICIGLSDEQLELLGTSPDAMKVSRRDLPFVVAQGRLGATTVAATMICAALAGIAVFVTGGIGGVHRGAETSFDISADLQELAHTSVAVVCAGVKSILDIGLTLEYLETHGVPVISVGQAGLPRLLHARERLQRRLPVRQRAGTGRVHPDQVGARPARRRGGQQSGAGGVRDAEGRDRPHHRAGAGSKRRQRGVTGKAVTPFLLDRIKQLTEGRSLATNIALVKHNAVVGAQLALALHDLPGLKPI